MKRLLIALIALLVAAPLFAQNASQAQLRLVVVDETGAGIPGATIVLTPASGAPVTATSDDRGLATLPVVPVGNSQLHVEFGGFETVDMPVAVCRCDRRRSSRRRSSSCPTIRMISPTCSIR